MRQRFIAEQYAPRAYRDGWEEEALCAGMDVNVFFPENSNRSSKAWAFARWHCDHCPVKRQCLDDALRNEGDLSFEHRYGMRGGLTPWARFKKACPEKAARVISMRNEWHARKREKQERELVALMEVEGNEGSPAQE
jgi:WhiB family redox-sensing transcriptional regulator